MNGATLEWTWPLSDPDRWLVFAKNPDTFVYFDYGTTSGSVYTFDTSGNYGTFFGVIGMRNSDSEYQTLASNEVVAGAPGYVISGTFGNESAIPGALPDFAVTNGTDAWFADSTTGSYGFRVPSGWNGSVASALYITLEGSHSFGSVVADMPGVNFTVPTPFIAVADNYFNWNTWPATEPDRWLISARNPVDLTYSAYATNAGTDYDITIAGTGSYYNIRALDAASNNVSYTTPDTYAAPPLPPVFSLDGSVFSGTDGSGIISNIYVDGVGTVSTDSFGYWNQGVTSPYTGYVAVADPGFDGTFNPAYRAYVGRLRRRPIKISLSGRRHRHRRIARFRWRSRLLPTCRRPTTFRAASTIL